MYNHHTPLVPHNMQKESYPKNTIWVISLRVKFAHLFVSSLCDKKTALTDGVEEVLKRLFWVILPRGNQPVSLSSHPLFICTTPNQRFVSRCRELCFTSFSHLNRWFGTRWMDRKHLTFVLKRLNRQAWATTSSPVHLRHNMRLQSD